VYEAKIKKYKAKSKRIISPSLYIYKKQIDKPNSSGMYNTNKNFNGALNNVKIANCYWRAPLAVCASRLKITCARAAWELTPLFSA
jgi:hypothetical protein